MTNEIAVAIIGAIATVIGGYLIFRRGTKGDQRTTALAQEANELTAKRDAITERDSTIADLRAALEKAVERIDLVDAHAENRVRDAESRAADRIGSIEKEQQASKRREHIRDDYISELRQHIQEGKGPPAPPWPKELYF